MAMPHATSTRNPAEIESHSIRVTLLEPRATYCALCHEPLRSGVCLATLPGPDGPVHSVCRPLVLEEVGA